ncbi:hypothetical protein MHU86_12067 [Fragilaria crotonensis]|nr:hypothetical protein MHU86_20882 [Fragilaria crotonensis]KAI2502410.1 hypothetical protein MHU86_12067 [Fragilaria crotonensis]
MVVQNAIKTLMSMCVTDIPLSKNKSWKFPKFHELLHLLDNMERFGAPINYCAQRPESLLIPVAKKPGRRAQKRHNGSAYELQSAQRLSYSLMINAVYTRIWDTTKGAANVPENTNPPTSTGKATFGTLTCDFTTGYRLCWHTQTNVSLMHIPDTVLQFLSYQFGSKVHVCTELRHNASTYRCHPSFQSGGPVYDWMNVNFKTKTSNRVSVHPCRLTMVVVTNNLQPIRLVVQKAYTQLASNQCF